MIKIPEYINISFYLPPERRDRFTIESTNSARASYYFDGSKLVMYVDNIWQDTQTFEDFIEALNVVFLTELLCMNHKKDEFSMSLCLRNGKGKNNCLFLLGAKKALNSNYTLFKND